MNPLELNKSNSFSDFMEYLKWAIKSNEGYSIKDFLLEEIPQNRRYSDVEVSLVHLTDDKLKNFGYQILVVMQGDINIITIQQLYSNNEDMIQKELEDIRQGVELIAENYEENEIKEMKSEGIMEMIYNRSSIRILEKKKVPIQYETSVMVDAEQIELEPGIHFKIDKPTGIIDVDEEDFKSKLDELEIISVMDNIIKLKVIDSDTAEEKTVDVDMSKLFKGYVEFVKYANELGIRNNIGNYLVKLLYFMGSSALSLFVSIINSEYKNYIVKGKEDAIKKEKENLEVKEKVLNQREKEIAQQTKGKSMSSTTNTKPSKVGADINKTLREILGTQASTRTRTVRNYGKKEVASKEEEEPKTEPLKESVPVQPSSTIPINELPGEQTNKTKDNNTKDNDLKATEKEKDEFQPGKYGLDKSIKIGDIELEFKKEQPNINNIEELKNYNNVALINKYLGDELDHINNQLEKYAKYLGWNRSTYLLLLSMIQDQKQIEIFKKLYDLLKREEELYQADKDLQIKNQRLNEEYEKHRKEADKRDKEFKEAYDKLTSEIKEDKDKIEEEKKRNEEERKRNEEKKKQNEEESIRLEKEKKATEEKKVEIREKEKELNKQDESLSKIRKEVFGQNDRNKEDWEQIRKQREQLSMLSNQVQAQAQAQANMLNEQSQQFAQQFTQQPVNQTIVEEQPVQSVPGPEEIITELLKGYENENQIMMIENPGTEIRVVPDDKINKDYQRENGVYKHNLRDDFYTYESGGEHEKEIKFSMYLRSRRLKEKREERRKRIMAIKRDSEVSEKITQIKERREELLKQLYGELYGLPVNDNNKFDIAFGVVRVLLGNITVEEFGMILSNFKPSDSWIYSIKIYYGIKEFRKNEFEILYIIHRMYQPKELKEELEKVKEKIIRENSKELQN